MPEFESYVDVDVDEFLSACSIIEKDELIDALEKDGWVKRTSPKGSKTNEKLPSILEIEWQEMCNKLSEIRQRISPHDEESIKEILDKY
jgi:hypothetical protein